MKVVSQSKDREVEIPDDTPMLLAEESKRIRSFRNARGVRTNDGEYFCEGDLWKIEKKEVRRNEIITDPRRATKR